MLKLVCCQRLVEFANCQNGFNSFEFIKKTSCENSNRIQFSVKLEQNFLRKFFCPPECANVKNSDAHSQFHCEIITCDHYRLKIFFYIETPFFQKKS